MVLIAILSSSVRISRKSDRVALYFQKFITANNIAETELLDLEQYDFPIFKERLKNQKNPLESALQFAEKIKKADGIIIVTPEYNGGYPASLKNAIDLLYDEWHRKPIAIVTVSNGVFGGTQVLASLQFTLWKIRATTVTAMFPVRSVQDTFTEIGDAVDEINTNKLASIFIEELMRTIMLNKQIEK